MLSAGRIYLWSLLGICIFLVLFKIPDTAGLYLTDGNNYLLYARLLEQGKLLYRDIYLDNFPLMIYISVLYKWLTFGSMQFFNLTTTIEKSAIALLLYRIALKKWKHPRTAFMVGVTFLGSYTVLASSFQLGFFTSVLFILVSYYCVEKKLVWLAGIAAALAVLTKAYSIFVILGLFAYVVQQYRWKAWQFVAGGSITALVIMLPTLIFALPQFLEQTLHFGLVRAPSVDKTNLYYLFIVYDFLTFFLVLWNVTLWRKNLFLALGTSLLILFFAGYKDVYYAYFSFFPLLAALGAGYLLEQPLPFTKIVLPPAIYATFLVFAVLVGFPMYLQTSRFVKSVPNEEALINVVKAQQPDSLYGHSILVNGVSYLTGIPIFDNMYEITTAYFTNGKMTRSDVTKRLMHSHALLLLYSYQRGNNVAYDASIIDTGMLAKAPCKRVYSQFLEQYTAEIQKQVSVVRCY